MIRARRPLALVVAAATLAGACGGPTANQSPASSAAVGPSTSPSPSATSPYASTASTIATLGYPKRTVFIQLFEWKWTDIATECERWLGPHGFAAVQISPPNEHALIDDGTSHFPWWERYQAVSYRIESRSGSRAEFADMVTRCRAAGVDIYADVLLNHMAAGQGTGSAGTAYTKYTYPGLYVASDFHANPNPTYPKTLCARGIQLSIDPVEVQTCELAGLADLRTEEPKVQETLAGYLADLYGLGVRGFRIDAAKHIAAGELRAILRTFRAKLAPEATFFVDQEVTDLGGDVIPKSDYYATGSVDHFVFSATLSDTFLRADRSIAALKDLAAADGVASPGHAVTFVDNHDTQRGRIATGLVLTYKREALYALATTFLLAWPGGYPRLMSSYVFSDTEAGPPSDADGHTTAVYSPGSTSPNCGLEPGQWVCEQRWHAIAGMVGFRDFTAAAPTLANWWSNPADRQQIAFGRGHAGFVAINRSQAPLTQTLQTGLAAGAYCNVVGGAVLTGATACSGTTITVAVDGTAMLSVPPMQALAIHVGARVGG